MVFLQYVNYLPFLGKIDFSTLCTMTSVFNSNTKNLNKIEVPTIIIQGGNDKICRPDGAWDLFETSPSIKIDLLWFPDAWHEIWLEPNWE